MDWRYHKQVLIVNYVNGRVVRRGARDRRVLLELARAAPITLGALLQRVAGDRCDRQALGCASREIIARWTPQTFADGLMRAATAAAATPFPRGNGLKRLLLKGLLR